MLVYQCLKINCIIFLSKSNNEVILKKIISKQMYWDVLLCRKNILLNFWMFLLISIIIDLIKEWIRKKVKIIQESISWWTKTLKKIPNISLASIKRPLNSKNLILSMIFRQKMGSKIIIQSHLIIIIHYTLKYLRIWIHYSLFRRIDLLAFNMMHDNVEEKQKYND